MYDIRFLDKEILAKVSSFISVVVLVASITVLSILFLKLYRHTEKLNDKESMIEFKNNYSVLVD
jgi:hypothetical protein